MTIKVLGTLDVRYGDAPIVPQAGKPKQVLALLALRCGHVVSTAQLMDEIWGDDLPRSAATTLQTYILQIRRMIAQAGGEPRHVLRSSHGGYMLLADGWQDVAEFESLGARGAAALESGNPAAASPLLGRALTLWRGPALTGVSVGRVLEPEQIGLEEARMHTVEQRIEAELRQGRNGSLVPELRRLVAAYPMNENLAGQLMRALAGCGQTSRALDVFQQLRDTLVGELGIEPSPRSQRLHQAVLAGVEPLNHAALAVIG